MQLRLTAAVAGLILLVLFTFVWRPPQANPDTALTADVVEDAGPELILAPPPEELAASGTVRQTDRRVQPVVGSTLSTDIEIRPAVPVPQAGSTTKPKPLPKPARIPGNKPPRPAEAGSAAIPRRPPAIRAPLAVPEAGSVARKPGVRAALPMIALGPAVNRTTTPGPTMSATLARFIAIGPDGLQIAVGDSDGEIRLIDVATRSVTRTFKLQTGALFELMYTPDGSLLVSATGPQLNLYDTATGDIARRYSPPDVLDAMAVLPGGEHLVATTNGGHLIRFSLTSGDVSELGGREAGLAFAVSPNGRYAATGATNGITRVWHVESPGAPQLVAGVGGVRCLAFSPDSRQLAIATSDNRIRVWTIDAQGGFVLEKTIPSLQQPGGMQFGRNPRHLYVTSQSAISHVYRIDTQTGAMTPLTEGNPPSTVRDMAMSSDGLTLVTLFRDRSIHVVTLDPATSAVQKQFTITTARNP